MWTIFKVLLNLLQYCFCFMLFFFLTLSHVESYLPDQGWTLHPLLSSIFPSIRVFSNALALHFSGQSIGVSASALVFPMNIQD